MDDSDQDFVDVCSKPLKRVRKKPAEARKRPRAEQKSASQGSSSSSREKRMENHKRDVGSGAGCVRTQPDRSAAGAEPEVVCRGTGHDSGGAGRPEKAMRAKDKVLQRMQQFKRASPQKMASTDKSQATQQESDFAPPPAAVQRPDTPEDVSPGLRPERQDGDEALALRLQQELDREATQAQTVDLEDGGLFFCHICHRDLTHMTPDGRSQHVNRCLDESEERAPAPSPPPPPPPPPGVPDCPICGKKFKSQKSRSAHLKRCSSDMGVPPAVLLQALQRQAEETQSVPAASRPTETGATKRKGSSKTGVQARKKPRQNAERLDEETMVALALSSSLVEQQKESERASQAETVVSSLVSAAPELKWRPDAGKGRGKKKKGAVPRPPPLLLIQDAEAAVARLQERVSALLLRNPPPSPPTPTRRPSSLSGRSGAAPLWQKSSLLEAATMRLTDFYVPELSDFITPCESTATDAAPSSAFKPESSVPPVSEGAADSETRTSSLPFTPSSSSQPAAASSSSQPAAASSTPSAPPTPQTQQPLVSSQALRDLMELAEEGMRVTQCGYAASCADRDSAGLMSNLQLSGFLPEEPEEQADLQTSGFLPETHARSDRDRHPTRAAHLGAAAGRRRHTAAALSRLGSDLGSMVNNPQLSDVQLQVDSGDVYFAHSFMVYARCPLLAEMVHESGFGVQEDGMPAAQRVLLTDVPGQAVLALLRYLYTAQCSVTASLRPHVLELASRFDLEELRQLCELRLAGDDEDGVNQEESATRQTDQAFMELLRSMWNEGGEDGEATDAEGGPGEAEGRAEEEDGPADDLAAGDGEACEEKVNEEELEEIYEFAATQKKKEEEEEKEEADTVEEEEEEEEEEDEGGREVFEQLAEPSRSSQRCSGVGEQQGRRQPETSMDRNYSRLFSGSWGTYEDGDSASTPPTSQPNTDAPPSPTFASPRKSLSKLSDRALLQSSGSVVAGLSPSPPSCVSNLPVPGLSPGQGRDQETDAAEESPPVKRESRGPRSICRPVSPDPPQNKTEPELIVLSDSSSETEMVLSSRSPSPPTPRAVENRRSYTHIKPQPVLTAQEPASEASRRSESSPGLSSHTRDPSPPDCSPEVSWLIPSTPLQPGGSTTSSSTQTRSSMCRTRLFPKSEPSSPSSVSSSPVLLRNSRLQASQSPVPVHISPAKDSFQIQEASPRRSSPDPDFLRSSRRKSSHLARDLFAVPGSQSKRSPSTFSKQDTPLHPQPQPYSSTPLHALHQQPPNPPPAVASPLHGVSQKASSGGTATPPESLEKTELGSFHPSPLSDPSEPTCSSSHGAPQSSPQGRQSGGFGSHGNTGSQVTRGKEDGGRDADDEEQRDEAPGESAEAESSFRHSFMVMDEPPIAFNDSWGLDACVDANPGRFSLRLEDSGGSGQRGGAATSSSSSCQMSPPGRSPAFTSPSRPPSTMWPRLRRSPAVPPPKTPPEISNSLLDSKIWDSWGEEEEEALPLSHRVKPSAQLRTPALSRNKRRRTLVPITPMPHYSDMDTPELKNKLNRFGVRPLPKRQMILKLREIHQYTHQLASSDSEDDAPSARTKPPHGGPAAAVSNGPRSCAQTVTFKEPTAPPVTSPLKFNRDEEEAEPLSASQGSNTSSAAEESERSNPELAPPSSASDGDSDADSGISASQAATRLQDRLRAVRTFILSDPELYTQILQYQPLVLSTFQAQLKAAGIRLGAAKLVDFLDSQCITFTTAKPGHQAPGHQAPGRGRGRKPGPRPKVAGDAKKSRKKGATAVL